MTRTTETIGDLTIQGGLQAAFASSAARRPHSPHAFGQDSHRVTVTSLTESARTQDFTFDWRALIDPRTRVLVPARI